MKKRLFICLLGLLVSLSAPGILSTYAAEKADSTQNFNYSHDGYGLSVSLPPGDYKTKDTDDGFSIKDGKGFTLLTYTTTSFAVFEKSFEDAVLDMHKELDTVSETITKPEENTFYISGLKHNNLIHIKCILGPEYAKILRITHGKSAHEQYKELCIAARDSFK